MRQTIFVVWRECFEALLVIGIIYAWVKQHPDRKNGMYFLLGGVVVGVLVAIALAMGIYGVFNILEGNGQTIFMMIMSVIACVLIVQMVYWMNKHAKTMKKSIESYMQEKVAKHSWWGALIVIAVAIAREGSEIVVFLSGQIMQLNHSNYLHFLVAVLIGIVVSALTFYAFILTSCVVQWKKFFTVTSLILLFLAVSLLLLAVESGTNLLLEYDIVLSDFLINPAWDTSAWLDDSGLIGDFASSCFGYRSQPMGISVLTFVFYWLVIAYLFLRKKEK